MLWNNNNQLSMLSYCKSGLKLCMNCWILNYFQRYLVLNCWILNYFQRCLILNCRISDCLQRYLILNCWMLNYLQRYLVLRFPEYSHTPHKNRHMTDFDVHLPGTETAVQEGKETLLATLKKVRNRKRLSW